MGIAIPGLGSGLDVNSMITSLMQAEAQPQTLLKTQQSNNSVKAGAWASLASIVTSLQATADAIKTPDLVPAVTASTNQPSLVTLSSTSSALPGSTTFRVLNLASAQQLAWPAVSPTASAGVSDAATTTVITAGAGAGTVTVTGAPATTHHTLQISQSGSGFTALVDGTAATVSGNVVSMTDGTTFTYSGGLQVGTLNVGIAKTAAGATAADLAAAISTAGGPARASLVDLGGGSSRLVLSATATGAAGALNVQSDAAVLAGSPDTLSDAQDARIVVGTGTGAITVARSSNTVTDLLAGVTINLLAADPDPTTTPITVSVAQDSAGTTKKVQSLVDGLNSALGWIGTNTAYDSTKNTGGPMMGESGVRDLNDALVRAMQTPTSTGSYHSLGDLGIKLQQDGTYTLDTAALQSALTKDPDSFAAYVSSLASAVSTVASAANGDGGSITLGKAATASTDKSLQDQIDTWTSRLSDIQARYEKMFSDLDVAMQKMKSQQAQLTSSLASLPTNG